MGELDRSQTFNLKLVIRGAPKTGKSSLFARLKGSKPIPSSAQQEIQVCNVKWVPSKEFVIQLKGVGIATSDDVNLEVWDVVDPENVKVQAQMIQDDETTPASVRDANNNKKLHKLTSAVVDVYKAAYGVLFLVDPRDESTLEFVKEKLGEKSLPEGISILIVLNFRDEVEGGGTRTALTVAKVRKELAIFRTARNPSLQCKMGPFQGVRDPIERCWNSNI